MGWNTALAILLLFLALDPALSSVQQTQAVVEGVESNGKNRMVTLFRSLHSALQLTPLESSQGWFTVLITFFTIITFIYAVLLYHLEKENSKAQVLSVGAFFSWLANHANKKITVGTTHTNTHKHSHCPHFSISISFSIHLSSHVLLMMMAILTTLSELHSLHGFDGVRCA